MGDDKGAFNKQLIAKIAGGGATESHPPPASLDFARIEIRREKSQSGGAYSLTDQSLTLHTDDSFKTTPHQLMAFQFVRPDPQGGDTLMMPIENVLNAIGDEVKLILSEPSFQFREGGVLPVLWEGSGGPRIRYYRPRVTISAVSERGRAAMDALDAVLSREDLQFRFHAMPAETVFMHNCAVLHGRTSFSAESDRLMYRIRAYASCLN